MFVSKKHASKVLWNSNFGYLIAYLSNKFTFKYIITISLSCLILKNAYYL